MDETRLSEIEARANAASRGPWQAWPTSLAGAPLRIEGPDGDVVSAKICTKETYGARGFQHLADFRFAAHARQDVSDLVAEVRRLQAERDNPETHDFLEGVRREAAHQRARWGTEHDDGKTDADWFWLVGHLASKALLVAEKRLHHLITTAAALLNWHLYSLGKTNMRPGIADPDSAGATAIKALKPYGGRQRGDACGCGGALAFLTVPGAGLTPDHLVLACSKACGAAYREDGAHWCPKCSTWPGRWVGGTDRDPQPWCSSCGAPQPGWPPREKP